MPPNTEYFEIAHQRHVEKKTHVSFPQLKYPSLRDEGLKHPAQWLDGKVLDDGAEGLWRVHDGLYDLKDFINKHPGGTEWLTLTKGTDITEAFECHHLTENVNKILDKYYVRDAKTPRNSPFTFKDDGFFRTLKRDVVEVLKTVPKNRQTYSNLIIDSFFVTLLTTSVLACVVENYWLNMVCYLVASLSLAWMTVAAHNYIHRKDNWRMYLFNFSLWSYRDFRVSHALSHHLYPNTLMDLEVSGFEPFVFWMPRADRPFWSKFAFLIQLATFPFIFPANFIKRFLTNFNKTGFFSEYYRMTDALGLLLPVWMWFLSGATFYHAFTTWLWILCTGSFIFFNIGSNAAHYHPDNWWDGDETREETRDWGMHELEAVFDRSDVCGNLFKVLTLFGDHTLHHLFPTLDHAVLPYLYPVFIKNCEKFQAKYKMCTSADLILGQIRLFYKTHPNLHTEEKHVLPDVSKIALKAN